MKLGVGVWKHENVDRRLFHQGFPQTDCRLPEACCWRPALSPPGLPKVNSLHHQLTHSLSAEFRDRDPAAWPTSLPTPSHTAPPTGPFTSVWTSLQIYSSRSSSCPPCCMKPYWQDCPKSTGVPMSGLRWPLLDVWRTCGTLSHRGKCLFSESSTMKQEKGRI